MNGPRGNLREQLARMGSLPRAAFYFAAVFLLAFVPLVILTVALPSNSLNVTSAVVATLGSVLLADGFLKRVLPAARPYVVVVLGFALAWWLASLWTDFDPFTPRTALFVLAATVTAFAPIWFIDVCVRAWRWLRGRWRKLLRQPAPPARTPREIPLVALGWIGLCCFVFFILLQLRVNGVIF